MENNNLTPKQKAFCDYYIEGNGTGGMNAAEAYIKAGYNVNANIARVNASRLLTNANVKDYIDARMAELENERIAKPREVLQYLTRVMRNEERDQLGLDASLQDRTKAAELLGKRYRLFTEKTELSGTVKQTIQFVDDLED